MATHQLHLATEPFTAIAAGTKTIECRLFDEKRQLINLGDEIVSTNRENPEQTLAVKVVRLLRYETFHDLFSNTNLTKFGAESVEQLENQINEFYTIDQQRACGVLGIEFVLID